MTPDLRTLAELASRSVPRAKLSGKYLSHGKSMSLFRWGYSVSFWYRTSDGHLILEFNPRKPGDPPFPVFDPVLLPRLTIDNFADQARLHVALGLGVTGPGEPWDPRRNAAPGLFDEQFLKEAS